MSKKKKIANSNLTLEAIDKLNLIKIDVSFISNLLISWNINQNSLSYDDMHGMSRVCDSISEQLHQCGDMLETMDKGDRIKGTGYFIKTKANLL